MTSDLTVNDSSQDSLSSIHQVPDSLTRWTWWVWRFTRLLVLASTDLKWPLTSTKTITNHEFSTNVPIMPLIKYGQFELSFLQFPRCFDHCCPQMTFDHYIPTSIQPKTPLRGNYCTHQVWDWTQLVLLSYIMLTRFQCFDHWWSHRTFDLHHNYQVLIEGAPTTHFCFQTFDNLVTGHISWLDHQWQK